MFAKFSLTSAVAAAALAFAVAPASADRWGADQWASEHASPAVATYPDAVERALTAKQIAMLDGRERSLGARALDAVSVLDLRERAFAAKREAQLAGGTSPDVVERAVSAAAADGAPSAALPGDTAIPFWPHETGVAVGTSETFLNVRADGSYLDPSSGRRVAGPLGSNPAAVTSTGTDVDWPQISIGFGLGFALALGAFLAMRVVRIRPLAP